MNCAKSSKYILYAHDDMAHTCRFIDKSNGFLYSGCKGQVDGDTMGLVPILLYWVFFASVLSLF